jgi:hypothetical protein
MTKSNSFMPEPGSFVRRLQSPSKTLDGPRAEDFFMARSGVCVYVTVRNCTFRVQFVAATSQGLVADQPREGADEALVIARAALRRHEAKLAPLFEQVALRAT